MGFIFSLITKDGLACLEIRWRKIYCFLIFFYLTQGVCQIQKCVPIVILGYVKNVTFL